MTHQDVISRLLATYELPSSVEICDSFKFGDPSGICTGVVTTCVLTPNVIREAVRLGCNLIIVHEPSFYTHNDDASWLADSNVYKQKSRMLRENGMVVWRHHDYMHFARQDEIMVGVLQELGWQDYVHGEDYGFIMQVVIPETTVRELSCHLKEKFHLQTGRIIGQPEARVSRIAFCGHIFASWNEDERRVTQMVEENDIDVLIPGEMIDWTTASYVRDAAELGMPKALIQTGHFNLEEPGMRYLASKVSGLFPEIPVHFVPAGDAYHFI